MLWFCKSVVSVAMYALNSSGPMTVLCHGVYFRHATLYTYDTCSITQVRCQPGEDAPRPTSIGLRE